jgi:hypothetical protein
LLTKVFYYPWATLLGIAVRLKAKIIFFAPTGLRHKAQGCGESRYPGTFSMMIFNPNGVA